MGIFNFFKKKTTPVVNIPCPHKWKDFNWYLEWNMQGSDGSIKNKPRYDFDYRIIEPYVCTICHVRKNITLESENFSGYSEKEVFEYIEELEKKYPLIQPRAIVENDINDYLLVDREYLAIRENKVSPQIKI